MRFTLKKPSKKILLGAAVLSVVLHLFVCKLPVDAFKATEIQVEKLPENVLPIQIISIAAPRINEVKKAEEAPKVTENTEITAPVKNEKSKYNFSEKAAEEKPIKKPVIEKKVAETPMPKSLQPQPTKVETQQPPVQAQMTSNDVGNAATTVIPVVKQANYTQTVAPTYPGRSIDLEQQGTVIIHALVDENGNIRDLVIKRSSGYNLLDNSAKEAVAKWRFNPSQIAGNITKSWVEVPVNFKLN